jgi:hypothetical protein
MSTNIINKYVPRPKSNSPRVISFIIGYVLCGTATYFLIKSFFIHLESGSYGEALFMVIWSVLMIFGIYIFSGGVVENFITASTIEVTEDGLRGYSRWGGRTFSIHYDDIVKISNPHGYIALLISSALLLKNSKGGYFAISLDVKGIADIADLLKEKALNAKEIRFGKWPDNRRLWTRQTDADPSNWD